LAALLPTLVMGGFQPQMSRMDADGRMEMGLKMDGLAANGSRKGLSASHLRPSRTSAVGLFSWK
jgi:hypothetical protein